MSIHGDRAYAAFMQGFNCAQSVAVAFAPELGLSEEQVKVYLFRARQRIKKRYAEIQGYGL